MARKELQPRPQENKNDKIVNSNLFLHKFFDTYMKEALPTGDKHDDAQHMMLSFYEWQIKAVQQFKSSDFPHAQGTIKQLSLSKAAQFLTQKTVNFMSEQLKLKPGTNDYDEVMKKSLKWHRYMVIADAAVSLEAKLIRQAKR